MVRRSFAFCLALALLSGSAAGRDRPIERARPSHAKMRALNVGITAFFTVFSAMRQQKISWLEVPRYLLYGAGAGAAFYEAKRLAGNGKTTAGWIVANATTSVVENVTSGEHPAGQIGYTVGPMRFRVATPWAKNAVATLEADISAAEVFFLGVALDRGETMSFRNGLITVDRDDPWHTEEFRPTGATFGVFPGIMTGAARKTWHHEVVHAIQFQQIDAIEPPVFTLAHGSPNEERRFFVLRHVRAGFPHLLNIPQDRRDYTGRWYEVEAYWLAEGTRVRR